MNKLALLASTALVLLAGCATTADAAPPKKQCPNGVWVAKNKPCPTPTPTPVPTPTPTPVPTPTPTPVPTPTPTPVPTPTPTPPGTVQLPSIPSNFDVQAGLEPADPVGQDIIEGAFRLICMPGHLAYDDPIVYPGEPGRSHLHQFFGNDGVNAFSTYETLRTTGESTCGNKDNRSGYWIPAMLNGKGQVVRPDYLQVYYKSRPKTDPIVSDPNHPQYQGQAVDLPRGLRYIFGYNMLAMTGPADPNAMWFNCDGPGAVPGHYPTIAATNCPSAGARLGATVYAPSCWDGVNLDSPDHRSHMAYASYTPGYLKCPATHPFVIPQFTLGAWYQTDADVLNWHLSSDVMPGMPAKPGGTTFHADWFGAWDDTILRTWHDNCINRMLACSGANLGQGQRIKDPPGFSWSAVPRLVLVPPRP